MILSLHASQIITAGNEFRLRCVSDNDTGLGSQPINFTPSAQTKQNLFPGDLSPYITSTNKNYRMMLSKLVSRTHDG